MADGVGSYTGGAIASSFVLQALADSENMQPEQLHPFLTRVHQALLEYASSVPELHMMSTTMTGICFCNGKRYCVHAGNTRAYHYHGGYLEQLTTDHTLYQELLEQGHVVFVSASEVATMTFLTSDAGVYIFVRGIEAVDRMSCFLRAFDKLLGQICGCAILMGRTGDDCDVHNVMRLLFMFCPWHYAAAHKMKSIFFVGFIVMNSGNSASNRSITSLLHS